MALVNNWGRSKWKALEDTPFNSKYKLIEFKGAGGFGAVFTVDEIIADCLIRDRTEIAIKLIPIDPDPDNLNRQIRELQLAVRLKHPCLINSDTVEQGQIDDEPYLGLVMELADMSLQDYILSKPSRTLPPDEVVAIAKSVASGLNYLHHQLDRNCEKIVHQDLKPANILRVKNSWKITDFGIARVLETGNTTTVSQVMGTSEYAPPEAFDNKIATAWDIWSLGIMLSGLLSGQHPFHSTSPRQLIRKILMEEPEIPDSIPYSLEQVIKGCLIKEYKQRWTAQQVLDGLSQTLRNYVEILPGGVELEMIAIPGGKFLMGTEDEEIERLNQKYDTDWFNSEKPQHQVTVQPFLMGKYPITQAQWRAIAKRTDLKVERNLDSNPAYFKGDAASRQRSDRRPVERVNWYDAVEFCARLSFLTGKEYRLPSEAEWEYACRAGTTTPFYFGETINTDLANYHGNYTYGNGAKGEYRQQTTPVGNFPPNAFGLYDLHGNVYEWCADAWHDNYEGAPTDGSAWLKNGNDNRSPLRGGSWDDLPDCCRSAFRIDFIRAGRDVIYSGIGFRVVCGVGRTT